MKAARALLRPVLTLIDGGRRSPAPIRSLPVAHDLGQQQLVLGLPVALRVLDGGKAALTAPEGGEAA